MLTSQNAAIDNLKIAINNVPLQITDYIYNLSSFCMKCCHTDPQLLYICHVPLQKLWSASQAKRAPIPSLQVVRQRDFDASDSMGRACLPSACATYGSEMPEVSL